jgi:hypothetical protein
MTVYLGFLHNTVTGEDFVAPADALDREHALAQLGGAYPAPVYKVLTVYVRNELIHILATMDKMPGMPSTPQPALADLLMQIAAKQVDGGEVVFEELPPVEAEVREVPEGRISRHASEAMEPPEPLIEKPRSLIEVLRGMKN